MEAINLFAPGPLNLADSYGLVSAMTARHLTAMGYHVNVQAFGGAAHPSQPEDLARIVRQPYRKAPGGVFVGYPTNYYKHGAAFQQRPRVAITMFETSRIPPDWPMILNEMDAVIVPSHFCERSFRDSGVTTPIHVIPLGIGEAYTFATRSPERPLTFLAFMDRGARKGGQLALQMFLMAFGDSMDVRFIWKARTPKIYVTLTNPNCEVIQRDMTEEELYQLYLRADVLIAPNKGEGFGLLPREASATGCISLATNWGGTADDIEKWGWPLPYMLEKADWKYHPTFAACDLGQWAKVDAGESAKLLRHIADNREQYQSAAREKAKAVVELYSWRRFAESIAQIWHDVSGLRAQVDMIIDKPLRTI